MPSVQLGDREQAAVEEFVKRLRAALGVNLVELRLFGSRARGEATIESDIDVLVVVAGNRIEAEDVAIDTAFDVNVSQDVYISPRVLTADSLHDPMWRATLFVRTLERDGVPL
jgi:predicted nucleotidyltransferase